MQLAIQLPPGIHRCGAGVPQIGMAARNALREVSQVMLAQQAQRACQAHLNAAIHQQILEPARALEAVVNQLAVIAERVAQQQYQAGGEHKQQLIQINPRDCQ